MLFNTYFISATQDARCLHPRAFATTLLIPLMHKLRSSSSPQLYSCRTLAPNLFVLRASVVLCTYNVSAVVPVGGSGSRRRILPAEVLQVLFSSVERTRSLAVVRIDILLTGHAKTHAVVYVRTYRHSSQSFASHALKDRYIYEPVKHQDGISPDDTAEGQSDTNVSHRTLP